MTQNVLKLIDDKRMLRHATKEADREKQRKLKNDITKQCRIEKEKCWSAQREQPED